MTDKNADDNNLFKIPPEKRVKTDELFPSITNKEGNDTEKFTVSPPLLLEPIASHRLIARHWSGTPMLNALLANARAIDALPDFGGETKHGEEEKRFEILSKNVERLHGLANDWLNTGHYSAVHDKFRLIYSYCCGLRAVLALKRGDFAAALKACDEGLLKGNDLEDGSLSKFATFLCQKCLPKCPAFDEDDEEEEQNSEMKIENGQSISQKIPLPLPLKRSSAIPRLTLPSLEHFWTEFCIPGRPLIIRGLVPSFPAFTRWTFSTLNERCGHRWVPVELGRRYTDDDWRQTLMPFGEYLARYVFPPGQNEGGEGEETTEPGYMAQHRLLDQIPELLDDIHPLPDYCEFDEGNDPKEDGQKSEAEKEPTINVFIGPAGTVSPLHTDPRHNLFCQIRGRKFVRLVHPRHSPDLYLFDDPMRGNSSQVDAENPDFEEFPRFSEVPVEDGVVEPGECLFIPRGYFHHVRALTRSISVSIWFGGADSTTKKEEENKSKHF